MYRLLQWILDLDEVAIGRDTPLSLQWQTPMPTWQLTAIALLAVGLVVVLYRREHGSRLRRAIPATVRALLFALLVVLICRPTLVHQQNRTERSAVAILVDQSRSMSRADESEPSAEGGSESGPSPDTRSGRAAMSRIDRVRRAFLANDQDGLKHVLDTHDVLLYSFAAAPRLEAEAAHADDLPALIERVRQGQADGAASDPGGAIQTVLDQTRSRRMAALVVLSDGRSTAPLDITRIAETAAARSTPIHVLPVGSATPPTDVYLATVRAEQRVFVHDLLGVGVQIGSRGIVQPTPVTVRLIDGRSGLEVASESITLSPDDIAELELRTKPSRPGTVRYRIEIDALPGESIVENNTDSVEVVILDDKLNVLYVDGYPRFEYRYIKNALTREPSIQLSVLLLEADPRFVQEGTVSIRRFPATEEELDEFDVVLFGDVDPFAGWLTPSQMRMLTEFVADGGGGFGLLAGERYAPQRFAGSPLEKLLPVQVDASPGAGGITTVTSGYNPRLTADGAEHRLYRFSADAQTNADLFDALPPLYWYARTEGPRPGATVLVEHPTATDARGRALPLMVLGRYGAGKLFFQATDDTWLWRRHTGEYLHDTYWVRVVRELMRPERLGRSRRFVLRTDRRQYALGDRVETQVELLDASLLAEYGDQLRVVLMDDEGLPVQRFDTSRLGADTAVYEGAVIPPRSGSYELQVEDAGHTPDPADDGVRIQVLASDPESAQVEADPETLARLAEATGGSVRSIDELADLLRSIPDRGVRIPDDVSEPLWDSKLAMILFALLISAEWIIRKAFGML